MRRKRGDGSLRWIPEKALWEARISYRKSDGSRGYQSRYAATERAAGDLLLALRNEYTGGGSGQHDGGGDLETYLKRWLGGQAERRAAATYRATKLYVEKRIVPSLGRKSIGSLTAADVRALDASLRREGVGIPTRHAVLKTLSSALTAAVREQLIARNVCLLVEKPKVVAADRYVLNLEESQALLEAARGTPYFALFVLAITTGMRQGELFALKWADVNLEDGQVFVRGSLAEDHDGKLAVKAPKTKASKRNIVLPAVAVEALTLHRRPDCRAGSFVFTDSEQNPIRKSNFLRREFYPLLERADLPRVTFHSLRHTANTLLLEAGESIHVLQQRGGWASARMPLDRYAHVMPTAQRSAATKLDKLFGSESEPS